VAVRDIGLRDATDRAIWDRARQDKAVIVTKDEDFVMLAVAESDGGKVLWVRAGNVVNRLLLARFAAVWPEVEAHLATAVTVVEMR
jgi:predicted nuclease of predicted toxin-antitoxin system